MPDLIPPPPPVAPPSLEYSWRIAPRWRMWTLALAPLAALGLAMVARALCTPDLSPAATITLAILLLAAILWATEAISGVATALLAIALIVALLGLPASFGHQWATRGNAITGWTQFLAPAGDPVMLLLLGSVILSEAARRTGMDRVIGSIILRPFAGSASRLVLGVLIASAWLSLWTSNTATAALMLSITRPLWSDDSLDRRVRAGILMAVALGANIGGLGSPVGTPPNAIVFQRLAELGHPMNFLQWMAVGVPIAVFALALGWVAMRAVIRWPRTTGAIDLRGLSRPPDDEHSAPPWTRRLTAVVFVLTIMLWITGHWTGIPVAVVALLPLAVFPVAGIVRPADFAHLEWDVLLLILGGLVLGRAMEDQPLAAQLVAQLPVDSMSPLLVVATMALAALALSAFMSNTATATLLCPIGLAVASAMESPPSTGNDSPEMPEGSLITSVGLAIAMGAGNAMFLPVSTPANALVARAGLVTTRQFLLVGAVVALAGIASVMLLGVILP